MVGVTKKLGELYKVAAANPPGVCSFAPPAHVFQEHSGKTGTVVSEAGQSRLLFDMGGSGGESVLKPCPVCCKLPSLPEPGFSGASKQLLLGQSDRKVKTFDKAPRRCSSKGEKGTEEGQKAAVAKTFNSTFRYPPFLTDSKPQR